ncbi:MAG: lysostaphin resistance A-like protein [Wenzhouxiangellaceae bacterium]
MSTPNNTAPDQNPPPRLGHELQRHPVRFAVIFEAALGVLAIFLAWLFGLRPWLDVVVTTGDVLIALGATVAVVAPMMMLMQADWGWVRELNRIVDELMHMLFRDAGPDAVFVVALLAGICEELLFRGVIQHGLTGPLGPAPALVAASLLFGLAHAVSRAYFITTLLIGLYLGALYQITDNLLVPILVHFLYDWIMLHWFIARMRADR